MRRLWLAYLIAAFGGCAGTPDPCAGAGDVCIAARVEGNAGMLDQLVFTLLDVTGTPQARSPGTPGAPFGLPVRVGLSLPAGSPPTGSVTVALDGVRSGNALAHDQKQVGVTNGRGVVTFTLNMGTVIDMTVPNDLADPPDLSKPPLTIQTTPATPDGGFTTFELEEIRFDITAADPASEPFAVAVDVPDGGMLSGSGPSRTFNWVPAAFQAGGHLVQVRATPMDTARRPVTANIPIRVRNGADPVGSLNPNDTAASNVAPANAIGDFDGDGFGDLASCSVTATGVYTVHLLYGDATGLPGALPPPNDPRRKSYSVAANFNTTARERLRCSGGDFDGDMLSDVIIGDPAAISGGAGQGMIFVVFGVARASNTTIGSPIMNGVNLVAGETLGIGVPVVGDYNDDGKIDVAAQTSPTGKDNVYIFLGRAVDRMMPTPLFLVNTPEINSLSTAPCGARSIQGFGDYDGTRGQELLVWDRNIGSTMCPTTVRGGISVFRSGATVLSFVRPDTAQTQVSFGDNGVLCDVDGDTRADLVVADTDKIFVFFATDMASYEVIDPLVSPPQLDITRAAIMMAPPGRRYADAFCIKNFFGTGQTTLILDPGDGTTTLPAHLEILTRSRTPSVLRGLPDPAINNDPNFGNQIAGATDVNGDTFNDLVVGASMGRYWVYFGR